MNLVQTQSVRVHGQSMYPTLCNEQDVAVDFYPQPRQLRQEDIGKVVLLRDQEEWILHRVVLQGDQLTTKGDWSLCFEDCKNIWGEVPQLRNTTISKVSTKLTHKTPRLVRWALRLFLLGYGSVFRGDRG